MNKLKLWLLIWWIATIITCFNSSLEAQELKQAKKETKEKVNKLLQVNKNEEIKKIQQFTLENIWKTKQELNTIYKNTYVYPNITKKYIDDLLKNWKIIVFLPLDKEHALALNEIWIKLPMDTIIAYGELYEEFTRVWKIMWDKWEDKPNKFDKSLELFEELPMQEKLFVLKLFGVWKDDQNLKTDKLKWRLSNWLIKFASNIYTLRQTLENDWDVPDWKWTEVVSFAKRIMKKVPILSTELTPEVMEWFTELEALARESVLERRERLEKELLISKERLDDSKERLDDSKERLDDSKERLVISKERLDNSKERADKEKQELAQEKRKWTRLDENINNLNKNLERLNNILALNKTR